MLVHYFVCVSSVNLHTVQQTITDIGSFSQMPTLYQNWLHGRKLYASPWPVSTAIGLMVTGNSLRFEDSYFQLYQAYRRVRVWRELWSPWTYERICESMGPTSQQETVKSDRASAMRHVQLVWHETSDTTRDDSDRW